MAARNGRYRHKITIQEPTETPDGFGQAVKSWANIGTNPQPFASVEPLRGRELFASAGVQSQITVRIRLQYHSGITTKMRVLFDGKIYNIEAPINPLERGREMQLMCSEGVNDG